MNITHPSKLEFERQKLIEGLIRTFRAVDTNVRVYCRYSFRDWSPRLEVLSKDQTADVSLQTPGVPALKPLPVLIREVLEQIPHLKGDGQAPEPSTEHCLLQDNCYRWYIVPSGRTGEAAELLSANKSERPKWIREIEGPHILTFSNPKIGGKPA